jgi:aminopeptidase YwaD
MKRLFLGLAIVFLFGSYVAKSQDKAHLEKYLKVLASDSLEGRKPGKPGGRKAAEYIINVLKENGIKPYGKNYRQPFYVVTDITLAKSNYIKINDNRNFAVKKDFIPIAFTKNGKFEGDVVFAWYGFDFTTDDGKEINDYAGMDVKGKWVMVLTDEPELKENEKDIYSQFSSLRLKAVTARDKGAIGIIFVQGTLSDEKDRLIPLTYDKSSSDAGIGVINITRKVANKILSTNGASIEKLEKEYGETKYKPHKAIDTHTKLLANIGVLQKKTKTNNIIAYLPGQDEKLKNEWVIIGAHYDHLGYGGEGSGSRMPDTIAVHNGADDNGSGSVAVLEIARAVKNMKHRRSIMLIWFGAEEMGLLGSKYFVEHPLVDLKNVVAMINIDMLGRLRDNTLYVGGVGTSEISEYIIEKNNKRYDFKLSLSKGGYGPSDHASFYMKNIPVLYFNTGVHEDYHTPFDDVDKINFDGLEKASRYVRDVLLDFANMEHRPKFREAGDKQATSHKYRYKVTLGIIPDFAGVEKRGLRVDGVRKGGPADLGGMKKGDIIIALDGKPVKNIYDYMARLSKLHKGRVITVEVIRGDKHKVLLVNL